MLCKPQIAFLRESILSILGVEPPSVFYIGGSDVLPPPLEKEAESAALAALEEGDEAARSLLIEHNLRLVVYISKHFENTGVNIEDLISIGTIGLIKAVNTFNAAKNIKLATYASRCIENEILMYLRKRGAQRSELSFDEPLNTDWRGLAPARGRRGKGHAAPRRRRAERPGARDHLAALWTQERAGIHAKGGGRPARHLPELHQPPREENHRAPAAGDAAADAGVVSSFWFLVFSF